MLRRLGFQPDGEDWLVTQTLNLLNDWSVNYGEFFLGLAGQMAQRGLPAEPEAMSPVLMSSSEPPRERWHQWRDAWWLHQHQAIAKDPAEAEAITGRLQRWNLPITPIRPVIERLWQAIDQSDDWQPLADWLDTVIVD